MNSPFAPWQPSWRRRLLRGALILLAVAVVLAVAVTLLQRDQPPSTFTIVAGPAGSASYLAAENYQRIAQQNGFDLVIVTTEDVAERLDLLLANEAQVAFIPSGAAAGLETDALQTLASVYYEPLWIIYRRALAADGPMDDLRQLQGMRIALGPDSISTERLARLLLGRNDISEENTTFIDLSRAEAVHGLRDGSLDVAFFAGAATEAHLLPLLRDPALAVMSVRRADAYARHYPFLTTVTLPEGVIDLEENLPAEDKQLLSAVANIVIRADLHPDLIRLMTIALVETHEPGGLFEKPFEFPRVGNADLPTSREYLAYLEQIRNGESQLDNILPFRLAALIDRIYLFVIPILLILVPVLMRSPAVYSAFMRRRLYTWYQLLRDIEKQTAHMNLEQLTVTEQAIDEMERLLVEEFSISRGYLAGYYDLRMHIALVRGKLLKRRESLSSDAADPTDPIAPPSESRTPPFLSPSDS
ncbi:putative TRAP transporter solute receptor, TAXI family [Candidatus Promineifilum breve]|uniref:TRAP transporter solute receptor, TAXI family n=1 Tax=Candidatus Promineifilum breve TaxID=1806508 RepID=A0A170PIE6_9CHLR|nr:putative TRAP transporter solute receptor, TAXI family [Candidatus Promineifilum breve]